MTQSCRIPHDEEQVNRRSLWLRLRRELWIVPAAAVMGALLAAAVYMGIWIGATGQRQYRQTSKFYLTFGNDAAGNPQDYYNDYTWNDLLFSVPAIYQVMESELPDGVTLETAKEDVEAQILSDVRLLTIQVTDADAETVQAVTNAVEDALVRYGSNAEEFQKIEFLSSDEVQQVVVTDRTQSAVVLGTVLGFLFGTAFLWIHELLNDGIYTPEEASKRYRLPVVMTLEQPDAKNPLPKFLEAENCAFSERQKSGLKLVGEETESIRRVGEQLQERYGIGIEVLEPAHCLAGVELLQKDCGADQEENRTAGGLSDEREALQDAWYLVIPFGKANGTGTDHLVTQLQARGYAVAGIILTDADPKFLRRYYGVR